MTRNAMLIFPKSFFPTVFPPLSPYKLMSKVRNKRQSVQLMCDGELCSTGDVTFYCFPKQKAAEEFKFRNCEVEE